jgi:hypothetical protein
MSNMKIFNQITEYVTLAFVILAIAFVGFIFIDMYLILIRK